MNRDRLLTAALALTALLVFGACENKEKVSETKMKCGGGKCGANMFDSNSALAKKKKNILSQMREGDGRKKCVIKAKTTKVLYDCVRDPKTGKMSLKCGGEGKSMKCAAGKCGGK